jgi:CRISPR/Cas system CSM-associated protein Csm3 (group 7 of RAMP superfamily)
MNPYDFVRIDWKQVPERRSPAWHHRFVDDQGRPLYAGQIEVDVYAETPLFIFDPRNVSPDPRRPTQSMRNKQGVYIIPGSSLKGLLRSVAEALGNGCLTLFDGKYEAVREGPRIKEYRAPYDKKIAPDFQHCEKNTDLCISCRIFGMLKEGASGVFLGKVNVSDACAYPESVTLYKPPIYTLPLMEPKPHHRAFYLDEQERYIAGRKFYFHHSAEKKPLSESKFVYFGKSREPANKYIQPLDYETKFHFRLDFSNLEKDEFALLLLALTLEEDMRHKIGYAKPLGLGSVSLEPTCLTLIDHTARYTQLASGSGKRVLQGDDFWDIRNELVADFTRTKLAKRAMEDLRRIWRWPADPDVEYYYPSKSDWFDTEESIGKRIADTVDTP